MEDMEPLAWSLLEHGADPDMYETKVRHENDKEMLRMWSYSTDCAVICLHQQRHTSLIRASHFGKKELVQQYLDHGANPNFQADVNLAAHGYKVSVASEQCVCTTERVDGPDGSCQERQRRHC